MRIVVLIIGMALVTYIPRAIPAVLIDKMRFGKKAEQFLSLIPYTAMTALIFPGILTMDGCCRRRDCGFARLEEVARHDRCFRLGCYGDAGLFGFVERER